MDEEQFKQVREQGADASVKHGLYRFRDSGKLPAERQSLVKELKARLETAPGRLDYKVDLAAHLAVMIELGFSEMAEVADSGKSPYSSPVVEPVTKIVNSLVRLLQTFPNEDKGLTAKDVLNAIKAAQEVENERDS